MTKRLSVVSVQVNVRVNIRSSGSIKTIKLTSGDENWLNILELRDLLPSLTTQSDRLDVQETSLLIRHCAGRGGRFSTVERIGGRTSKISSSATAGKSSL